jgi:ABC-type sugar transport system ATPase subunit
VSFTVRAGEIVGLAGLLGSGRTEILDMLSGSMPRASGTVRLEDREVAFKHPADAILAGIAHLPEDRLNQASFPDLTITDNFTAPSLKRYFKPPTIRRNAERKAMNEAISGPLRIKASGPDALMWTLSGGNQQKVVVGRWLATSPKLLLLDEPSQGVDVGARQEIHGMIRQSAAEGMAVLVVTSDFEELAQLAERVLVLGQGRITYELTGDEITPDRCYELAGSNERSDA